MSTDATASATHQHHGEAKKTHHPAPREDSTIRVRAAPAGRVRRPPTWRLEACASDVARVRELGVVMIRRVIMTARRAVLPWRAWTCCSIHPTTPIAIAPIHAGDSARSAIAPRFARSRVRRSVPAFSSW